MIKAVCKLCGVEFDSVDELYDHLRTVHKAKVILDELIDFSLDRSILDRLEDMFGCIVSLGDVSGRSVELIFEVYGKHSQFWPKFVTILDKLIELDWVPVSCSVDWQRHGFVGQIKIVVPIEKLNQTL